MHVHRRLQTVNAHIAANKGVPGIIQRTSHTSRMSAPRWQDAIKKALEKDSKSNAYQLATTDDSNSSSSAVPHVRSVIHRAFLAPISPSHPLLLTSTDIRTPKARQIAQSPLVELAWWIAPTQEQFRIAGRAYILPAPDFNNAATVQDADASRAQEQKRVEAIAKKLAGAFPKVELGGEGFDWEAKRLELFDGMSGHMKASWIRPVPGTPLQGGHDTAKEWPETLPKLAEAKGEQEKQLQDALRNFALVVIDPEDVDYVELGIVPNRRTHFFKNKEGSWESEAVVP